MTDITKLIRKNVLKLTPYSCARDEYKGDTGIFLDANESPYGTFNRYPDPYQKKLKSLISSLKKIDEENIFLGNGSDEVIDLCYRIFCNPGEDKVLVFPPTYGMYEVSASINDVGVVKIPLNNEFQIDIARTLQSFEDEKIKMLFLCTPNNPTSNSMNLADVETILKTFKGIVIIDEAYIDFSSKKSYTRLLPEYPNLIVMQTFSKAWAMAGVRIGMAFCSTEIISYFNKVKPPYNISSVNQETVISRLARTGDFRSEVDALLKERERMASELSGIKYVEKVFPSDANFLLVKVADADYLYRSLIDRHIIVRNRSSVINNCLRITIGKKNENDELLNALKTFGS
jgi:histidinol-phosphate aminotransferase